MRAQRRAEQQPAGAGAEPSRDVARPDPDGTAVEGDVTTQTVEAPPGKQRRPPASKARRTKVSVRHVGPLSVLRFSLIYYFCVMLVLYLATAILYSILDAIGTLRVAASGICAFGLTDAQIVADKKHPIAQCLFQFNGGWIFSRLFIIGVTLVVLWSVVKTVVAILYNLIADVVGGINVTLTEKR